MSKCLCLFDLDGTLTDASQPITKELLDYLFELNSRVDVAIVSGSDMVKVSKQLGSFEIFKCFPYVFTENGLVPYKFGKLLESSDIVSHLGEEVIHNLVNFILNYLSKVTLPFKRGTFVEFRKGMLNVSPVGRSCSQSEREAFHEYDKVHGVRSQMVAALRSQFARERLTFSIGGQISIDIFPEGWDKTFCLGHLKDYEEIHFFGDKTNQGGNDYEIFTHPRTIGHSVTSPADTINQLKCLFPA